MTRAVSFSGGGRPSLGGGALPVLRLVITPVSKMGSLPGGCDGAAGLLALGVGGADRFAGALLPGMWSLWPGGGPGGGPGGALPLFCVGGGWLGGDRCEGVPGGARFRTVTRSGRAMLLVEAGRFSISFCEFCLAKSRATVCKRGSSRPITLAAEAALVRLCCDAFLVSANVGAGSRHGAPKSPVSNKFSVDAGRRIATLLPTSSSSSSSSFLLLFPPPACCAAKRAARASLRSGAFDGGAGDIERGFSCWSDARAGAASALSRLF